MKNTLAKILIGLALLSQVVAYSQSTDYIINMENDTIPAEKIRLKYDKIKVRQNGKNKTYTFDSIKGFYLSKNEVSYIKVKSPNSHLKGARQEIFMIRLTKKGKVSLLEYNESGPGFAGIESYQLNFINITDSRPEIIGISRGGIFKERLSDAAYKQLRDYLYGNNEILTELDTLYLSKHKNLRDLVVDLVNKYNDWVALNK